MRRFFALTLIWLGAVAGAHASPWGSVCIQPVSIGQTINGQLSTSDCSWHYTATPQHQYYVDVFSFSGTAGQQVSVAMSSGIFDTYLELYDVNEFTATPIATNDDSGSGTNSRIPSGTGFFTLPATGTYYVWASSVNPDWTGAYALTISAAASNPPPALGQVTVTEFYHPGFNHYFITAYPEEAASLAAGNLPPWTPTGQTFKVWSAPGANITNVCRFFSASFAPRSSHFYSGNPAECPGLAAGGTWLLESSSAFYMMPTATGSCPSGTMPLYRLYNNGMSGAPNHRYTIQPSVRSAMIAAGWIPEGNGVDGVFACVPFSSAPPPVTGSAFQQEVTGYVNTLLGLVSGEVVDFDQLVLILGASIEALLNPASTCPLATSNPPLQDLTNLPPSLTIQVNFGSGCTVQGPTAGAAVAGSVTLTVSNLVFSDTALAGSVAITFNNVRVNGVLVANGSVQGTANIVVNPTLGTFVGTISVTFSNLQLPNNFGVTGTAQINLNSAGTTTVSTNLTTSPSNLQLILNASVVPQSDGSVLVNTTSASSVGAYSIQVVNVKIDAALCQTGAIGGAIHFTKGGETGTITFNSACNYEYTGP